METKNFCFYTSINGVQKKLNVKAPVENGAVITHKYCPQELLTGGLSFITVVNGEGIDEFILDCQKQCAGMRAAGNNVSKLDAHVAGLMASVNDHISRCGRLIFGDLLIYMDCFALLLEADGFSDSEIRNSYPQIVRSIVELYPDYIYNTRDLSPFKGSHFDFVLFNACHTKY